MFPNLSRAMLFLCLFLLAACGEDSPTAPEGSAPVNAGFKGPYVLENWEDTGITEGSTSVSPLDDGDQEATFAYEVDLGDRSGQGIDERYATFSTVAAASGTATIEWEYSGYHAFYQTSARLSFFALRDGADPVILDEVDGPAGGGFHFSGKTRIEVEEGQPFGFTIGGGHYDRDGRLRGTLTVTRIVAPR